MSDFDQIQFNTRAFSELKAVLRTKRMPNALLFYGRANTRRKEAAFFFAKGINCHGQESEPCHQCRSCKKIDERLHPDIHYIGLPDGKKNITISQIRQMGQTISIKANEAKVRVVIIDDADLMNRQAQNGLLKLLEEPPDGTVFLLFAQKKDRLLPTILSRCRKIRFRPLTEKMVADYLTRFHDVDPDLAHIVSLTTNADLKKALLFLDKESVPGATDSVDWIKRRQWILTGLSRLTRPDTADIRTGLEISQKLNMTPGLIDDTLAVMKTFFRDLLVFRVCPEKIVNLDFYDTFADINGQVEYETYFKWLSELFETEKRLISNANIRLTLDRFFLILTCNKGNSMP